MTKVKALVFFFGLLLSCSLAQAQVQGSLTASDSGACTTSNACVTLPILINMGAVAINLTGTFSATLQFEVSIDGGATWVAASGVSPSNLTSATSATAAGAWRFAVSGATHIRVRCSAYSSGTVVVAMQPSNQAASLWTPALPSSGVLSFGGDTGISRTAPGTVAVGTGAQGSVLGTLLAANLGNVWIASSYCTPSGNVYTGCTSAALAAMPANAVLYVPTSLGQFAETAGTNITLTKSARIFCSGATSSSSNGLIWDAGNHGNIEGLNATGVIADVEIANCHIQNSHVQAGGEFNNYAILARGPVRWNIHDNYFDGPGHGIDLLDTGRDNHIYHNQFNGTTDYSVSVVFNGENAISVARAANVATIGLGGQANVKVGEKINVYGLGTATPAEAAFNCQDCTVTAVATGATPTVSYANNGGALGTTSITGCSFGATCGVAINATGDVVADNTIVGMTDSGVRNGPAEYITMEDSNNSVVHGNDIADYGGLAASTNSCGIQNFTNHAWAQGGNVYDHNQIAEIPAAPSGQFQAMCLGTSQNGNGTYHREVANNNLFYGVNNGISSGTVISILESSYSFNDCYICGTGISVTSASGFPKMGLTIEGNNLTGAGATSGGASGRGIEYSDLWGGNIKGNNIRNFANEGIYVKGTAEVTVEGNTINNIGQAGTTNAQGIHVLAGRANNFAAHIENNQITDDAGNSATGTALLQAAIKLDANSINTHLCHNKSSGTQIRSAGLIDSGTGTTDCDAQTYANKVVLPYPQPAAPTLGVTCSASCAQTYTYAVVAVSDSPGNPRSKGSATVSTAAGSPNGALNGTTDFITINPSITTIGDHCDYYRTVSPYPTTGMIGSGVCGLPFTDNGKVGDNAGLPGGTNNGLLRSAVVTADEGTACSNGELALSAGWQSTGSATVTAVRGTGQTCDWTITTGTTTAANPTITDTLTNTLPLATTVCEMNIHGGTHTAAAGEGFQQTTLSSSAPVFTFQGTPTAGGTTYFVTRRCGP